MTNVHDIPLHTLSGEPTTLAGLKGKAVLIVNVASKCGLTPQYSGLERLQERHEKGTEAHHSDRPGEVSIAAGTTAETTVTFEDDDRESPKAPFEDPSESA